MVSSTPKHNFPKPKTNFFFISFTPNSYAEQRDNKTKTFTSLVHLRHRRGSWIRHDECGGREAKGFMQGNNIFNVDLFSIQDDNFGK